MNKEQLKIIEEQKKKNERNTIKLTEEQIKEIEKEQHKHYGRYLVDIDERLFAYFKVKNFNEFNNRVKKLFPLKVDEIRFWDAISVAQSNYACFEKEIIDIQRPGQLYDKETASITQTILLQEEWLKTGKRTRTLMDFCFDYCKQWESDRLVYFVSFDNHQEFDEELLKISTFLKIDDMVDFFDFFWMIDEDPACFGKGTFEDYVEAIKKALEIKGAKNE